MQTQHDQPVLAGGGAEEGTLAVFRVATAGPEVADAFEAPAFDWLER